MTTNRVQPEAFYRRYLDRCNAHRFDELTEFLEGDVQVNGERHGPERYAAGLQSLVEALAGFRWDIQQILVDGDWLAVRLHDTGTTRTGRSVTTQEFAIYHVPNGRIAAVWGDLDHTQL